MKTTLLTSCRKSVYIFLIASFGIIYSTTGQCPTITNATPPPICDASGYTFTNLSADYAIDNGNGIVWYNNPTGGIPISNNQLVLEGMYYADDNSGTCGTRASITIDFQVDDTDPRLDANYCSNENPTLQTFIDDVLSFYIPIGGAVEIYNDFNLSSITNINAPLSLGPTFYYVVFLDNTGCRSQIENTRITVSLSPSDPNPPSPQVFCSNTNPTIADLDSGSTATFFWYSSIDGLSNPILPQLSSHTPLVDGLTYYVQASGIFCDSNVIPVSVVIDNPNNPGTSASMEFCSDSIPVTDFNLFNELGGTPNTTGVWSGPLATTNNHLGTVNIAALTGGIYTFTYTVSGTGACASGTSNVTITINDILNSGTVSATNPAVYCEKDLPTTFDLSTLLDNEDAGGQWTQGTLSTDPIVNSPIDLSAFTPGTYNFTYTQNALPSSCPEASTTVQVEVIQDPQAGNAINQTFCANDLSVNSPFNLFDALDGTQDNNGGTWSDSNGDTITSSLDITGLTVLDSPYSFTYTLSNGTCDAVETISIAVESAPESGNALTPFEVCEENVAASSPFDLFTLLDGSQDTNGTWHNGIDASGAIVTNPVDISALTSGTYNYTYAVPDIGSCSDEEVTVQIIISPTPETGIPVATLICENELVANSPLDVFEQLTGEDTGGTWTDDDTTGAITGSLVDITLLTIGSYNFTYSITDANGCSSSSTVVVTIAEAPESGTINAPVEFCMLEVTTGQTYNLFDLLDNEDQAGTWNDDDGSSALTGSTVAIDALASGTYNFTYDVDAIGTCDDANVTVSIIINDPPAPTATASQEFCDAALISDLVVTGNDVQWYNMASGGTPLANTDALVDGQMYYATQTDAVTGCESSVRTGVTVSIYASPNAGNPSATPIIVCNNTTNVNLNTGLDGTQSTGGIWQDTDATGALTGDNLDTTGLTAGTYQFTYLATALAPCVDASTTILVTIDEPLNAGTDANLQVCDNSGTTDLFALLGFADTGGTWSPALTSGTGVFDPLLDASTTYTYTLTNTCGTVSSEVNVTAIPAPNAGVDSAITVCVIDGITDLFSFLGDEAQLGGTWSSGLVSGTGAFDPEMDIAAVYTYTVPAQAPCIADATAQITVVISDSSPPVVNDSNPEFCQINTPTVSNLNTAVTATGTIIWYEDAALTIEANPADALTDGEDYFATQVGSSGCESSIDVQVIATVNNVITPTLIDSNREWCINDDPLVSELTSNTNFDASQYTLVWYDANIEGTVISEDNLLTNGLTYYAGLIDPLTGCESSQRLEVTPNLTACGDLIIPDGFSPNGDGVNDTFDVDNLAILYPNYEMEIFNRNGNIVYKGNSNTPAFDGRSNQSRTMGSGDLPIGVYFYIFKYNNGENNPVQGRLYLSR